MLTNYSRQRVHYNSFDGFTFVFTQLKLENKATVLCIASKCHLHEGLVQSWHLPSRKQDKTNTTQQGR